MAPTPHLELRDIHRRLPSGGRILTILEGIDLTVEHGEFVAFLGPSGSGKSTLLALMAGLDRPSSGQILLDGRAIQDLSEDQLARLRRREIGFVFQSFQLLPHMTAAENVLLPLELAQLPEAEERAARLLEEVGLGDRGHHYPTQLSGGEQQRVALARAYACRPPLLLADEPTGNLDTRTSYEVLGLLESLRRRHGTTLVLVTHDAAVAAAADRLVYLKDGRIERQELTTRPSTAVEDPAPPSEAAP
ncbi:MAG: ABC transporter ATP-binding protein [Acidobacteria bacterium]|nr:ABC transporter ATP-binding protein [Acidobacteriota bacterium]